MPLDVVTGNHAAGHALSLAGEAKEAVAKAQQAVYTIAESTLGGGLEPIARLTEKELISLEKAQETHSTLTGIDTGYYQLNDMTAGLQKSDLRLLPEMAPTVARVATRDKIGRRGTALSKGSPDHLVIVGAGIAGWSVAEAIRAADTHTPVLVIDDDEGLLLSIKATLVSSGLPEPALLSDSRNALELVRKYSFQLILLDLMMPHLNGMEVLKKIKDEFPDPECVIVSASDDVATAVQAMGLGASDYLVKPLNSEKLIALVNRILEKHTLRNELERFGRKKIFSELKHAEAFADLIAEDEAMALVFHQVEAVAGTDYSVVINGESGTGKELLARAIHNISNRSNRPLVKVNCSALPTNLIESELFGHVKGAFTDAHEDRCGKIETT